MEKRRSSARTLLFFLRIFVSAALLYYLLLYDEKIASIARNFASLSIPFFLAAAGMKLLDRIFVSLRWWVLLRGKNIGIRFLSLFRIDFMANFLGIILPSSAGGDIVRLYSLSSRVDLTESFSSFAVDRILSLFAALSTAIVCLFFPLPVDLPLYIFFLVLFIFGAFLLFLALFIRGTLTRVLRKLPSRWPIPWALDRLDKFHRSFVAFRKNRGALFGALMLAYFCQAARILTVYLVSRALGFRISPAYFFIFVPIISIIVLLPVSFGGLGVREVAYVQFFAPVGLADTTAMSISLLTYGVIILVALPGGLFYTLGGLRKKEEKIGHLPL